MSGFADRLEQVKVSISDQADYLQYLLDQFDAPYDVDCSLRIAIDDLRRMAQRIHDSAEMMQEAKGVRRSGRRAH